MPSYSIILSSVTAFVGSCPSRYAFSAYVNASHTIDFLFLNYRSIFFLNFIFITTIYLHFLCPQQTFTCSSSAKGTLENDGKYIQS